MARQPARRWRPDPCLTCRADDDAEPPHSAAPPAAGKPVRARMTTLMAEPAPTTPGQFADFVKAEQAKYGPVVKPSGARVD